MKNEEQEDTRMDTMGEGTESLTASTNEIIPAYLNDLVSDFMVQVEAYTLLYHELQEIQGRVRARYVCLRALKADIERRGGAVEMP